MTSALSAKHFHDEAAAYKWVEARVWPDGRVCPHCGVIGDSGALKGKSTRIGVYKCYSCRKPFTVKVGTIFERSHVKLHIWLQAMHIMASSKKGFSSNQFARTLGVDLKTAWFMSHRIRLAIKRPTTRGVGGTEGSGLVGVPQISVTKTVPSARGAVCMLSTYAGIALDPRFTKAGCLASDMGATLAAAPEQD